ncbi:hypothetical protein AcV5_000171 [Taiwanofungus camphoratus]|nr:hypothetical protein AcV5_000171 [Antrodia cinnamomea]KAI0944976.1 hypothetical protein AcV7_001634 [Antrodia cinnamomea]
MLPAVRHVTARTLIQSRRGLSTETDGAIMKGALAAVGDILGESSIPSSLASPTPAPLRTSSNVAPTINIPPAEDPLLHYITSCIQQHGHRQKAARITARTLLYIHTLTRAPPMPILRKAVFAASPAVRCISNKHAGKTIVVPVPLSEKQRTRQAVLWLLEECDSRSGQHVEERLAREIIAVIQGESEVLKKKAEVHRQAMMNRGSTRRA